MTEEWRSVVGFPDYEVSNRGRVRSLDKEITQRSRGGNLFTRTFPGRVLRQAVNEDGRRVLVLRRNGESVNVKVHRLVLEAFIGPCPEGMETRHVNGAAAGDDLDNLAWGTKAENSADSRRLDEIQRGSVHHQARLDEQTVRLIRDVAARMFTHQQIAEALGVCRGHVSSIVRRERWAHVE